MATSAVEICNMALSRIGVKNFIADLAGQSTEARVASLFYANVRDAVLEDADWAFARKRAVLTATDEERTNWAYVYSLPSDCIAARKIVIEDVRNPGPEQRYPFTVELADDGSTKRLLTDIEDAELAYTARVTAVGLFSPLFVNALAWALAAEFGASLKASKETQKWAIDMYAVAVAKALAAGRDEEQEDAPPDPEPIRVRG